MFLINSIENVDHTSRLMQKFTLYLLQNPYEKILEDFKKMKGILKNKEKLRIFGEKLAQNLENLVFLIKAKGKTERVLEKKKFLFFFPLEFISSFMDEVFLLSEVEYYPIYKKIISNLIIFFSYFFCENSDLVPLFIESNIKNFSLEDLSKEINRDFFDKLLKLTFKKKRFFLFHIILKFLFDSSIIQKNEKIPKVYEYFFDVVSQELKSMNKFEIDSVRDQNLRTKFIFICDLIIRFTHQLEITNFYSSDLKIKKIVKIEEIFTKQVNIRIKFLFKIKKKKLI